MQISSILKQRDTFSKSVLNLSICIILIHEIVTAASFTLSEAYK